VSSRPARTPDKPFKKIVEKEPAKTKDAACERCGSFDAMEFAGQILCADCIQLAGCGCAGHHEDSA
jgi:hypothetical protein